MAQTTTGELAGQAAPADFRRGAWARRAGLLAFILALLTTAALLALLLSTLLAPRLLGYHSYVIYGGSMEPAIEVGSLVVARSVSADDLQVGDVVVYRSPGNGATVTHRIVGVRDQDGGRLFQTKGDASNGADPVEIDLAGGAQRVAHHLPFMGYFVHFAGSPIGIILLVVLPALGLLALYLTDEQVTGDS